MQNSQKKALFRQICKRKIEFFSRTSKYKSDKTVVSKLLHVLKVLRAKDVLLYLPLQSEVDISHIFKTQRGKINIYVPFMEGVSFKMVKFRLPLFKKKFNILEPKNSWRKISKLDVAVVPVLGVDGALRRVGFGKGMYDRFFESLSCKPYVIFVQLGECMTREKLCEDFDIQANLYLTPKKNIIRGYNDNRDKFSGCRSHHQRHSRIFRSKEVRCCKL